MIIYKLYKESLSITAHRQRVDDKKIDFYSFDQQTAKIIVQIKSPGDGKTLEAVQDVLIALERGGKKAVHNMTVEDYNENLVSFVLPDNIISQSGSFLCGIYLDYGNNKSLDVGYFRINLKQSLIDKDLPAMEQFYVQSFEELKDDIIQRSSDLKSIIDGIDTDVADKLQTLDDLAEDYAQKAADLEATYAPRLTEVTAQLAQTKQAFNDAVSKVTVDSEVILARTGVTGVVYETLDERLDDMERSSLDNDGLILGISWDKSANPSLTRTDAAIGMVADVGQDGELVQNDFDNAPIYRDIEDVTDEYGNEFVKIPKFYIQKTEDDTTMRIRISKRRHPGFYLPKVFWDFETGSELDYYLHGKYKANISADGTKLESKSGEYPLVSRNIQQFRTLAQTNNTAETGGYQQLDIHGQDVLSVLFTVEFATLNSQDVMRGFTSGRYTSGDVSTVGEVGTNRFILATANADQYRVGQTVSLGTSQGGNQIAYGRTITAIEAYDELNKAVSFGGGPVDIAVGNHIYNTGWKNGFSKNIAATSGYIIANDGKYPCSYRGIESPWGDLWQFVDGINITDNQSWVAENADDYVSNKFEAPYQKVAYLNSTSNGWVSRLGLDKERPFVNMATGVGAGSTTYYSDYYYQNTGQRVARVGGYWYNGSNAGLWYWTLNDSSGVAGVTVGGRLLKKAL